MYIYGSLMNIPDNCQRGYIQVDLSKIRINIHNLHKRTPRFPGIMVVVKSDGYGHGAVAIAGATEWMDCVYGFAVATSEEAFDLRENGITKPILIMGPVFPYAYERLINEQISIIIYNEETLTLLIECTKRLNKTVSVHLEIDTGMNRVGIKPDEEGFLFIKKITANKNRNIDGIYTHFTKADETKLENTINQLEAFYSFVDLLENELGLNLRYKHSSNSAGVFALTEQTYINPLNICRAGIASYGIWPSAETSEFDPAFELFPVLSLYSQIIMLKEVPPGEAISYGGTFITSRPTKVATIPIGYGDGYPRSLSNTGHVLIRGNKAPIIGRICMDFFMVDVTDILDVTIYDKVTLIGSDGSLKITVEDLSNLSGRFHYEIVCGLGKRLPRIYCE